MSAVRTAALVACLLAAPRARAQDATEEARTYFNAGAQAYAAGKYSAAIAAFERAHQLAKRPGILFSLAQAHRRQYTIDRTRASLERAIGYYRQYLESDPEGARRGESVEALGELEPIAARFSTATVEGQPAPEAKRETQLLVSSSTKGARVVLDGKPAGDVPFAGAVAPGKHVIQVVADGHVDHRREIALTEGAVVAVDVKLDERPAVLTLRGPTGAEVSLDGRIVGELPLPAQSLPPGRYFVAVTANGHEPFARELTLRRADRRSVDVQLEATGQRTAAWILLGTAGVGLLASGGLAYLALDREGEARDLLERRERRGASPAELDTYDAARDERDTFATATVVTAGGSLLVGAVGVVLLAFDRPRVAAPERDGDERPPGTETQPGEPAFDVSAAPWVGPGSAGAGLTGRF